jgi:predicted phosphodiesterase
MARHPRSVEEDPVQRQNHRHTLSRRAFVRQGTLFLAGSAALASSSFAAEGGVKPAVRIGLVTDMHNADKPPATNRYYRETLDKFAEAARQFAADKADFLVELGDVMDSADSLDVEKGYLKQIFEKLRAAAARRYCVLGNHCVQNLTKAEFLEIVGQPKSYYSFDFGGHHFIVLDACFCSDGEPYGRANFQWTDSNIPPAEVEWLEADLKATPYKTVVFVHQRLDIEPPYGVKNAPIIRTMLQSSGKVLAVLQGHDHKGDYKEIDGLHYCTLKAMVEGSGKENSSYAVLDIHPDHSIQIKGFRKQQSFGWK